MSSLLLQSELAMVSDELPVAIWLGRVPSGEVVYTNRAFREVLGIDPPASAERGAFVEPYGVHQLDGTPYPEDKMPFERAIAARETVVVDDLVIHRHDGRKVHLRVFAKPIFDGAGTITHVLEAFIDITREVVAESARIEGERKLARSQRLESLGQLATGIAHDFNNLLTVTTLTVSRLLGKTRDPDLRSALVDIDTVTMSAVELVRKLVGYATRVPQPLAPLEANTVVQSVVAISQRTFDRRIALAIDSDPAHPHLWIRGDRSQLEQVLMNLLVNARDAIPGAGTIVVRTREAELAANAIETCPAGSYVLIEVIDDGPGIDPAIRERVFEPYFTTKTRGPIKGTGLGLSTVLGIVRSHDGFIDARAAAPSGTAIRIAIPTHGAPPAFAPSDAIAAPRAVEAGNDRLVLVVDDELLVLAATATSLRSMGYQVLEARDGAEALQLFRQHAGAVSAVVLDMVMPGPSATEVFDGIRAIAPHVPIVLVTGAAMKNDVDALVDRGRALWLAKPFDKTRLAAMLDEIRSRPSK